jgi:hypothetical protein
MAIKNFLRVLYLCLACESLSGQSLLTLGGAGSRPDFLGRVVEVIPGGENWRYSLEVSQEYDSNPTLAESGRDERFYLDISPSISFLTDTESYAPNRIGITYSPKLRLDWSDSERSEILHAADAYYANKGARGELLLYASLLEISGAERLTSSFAEGRTQRLGANLSYEVASKSRVLLRGQLAQSVFDTPGISDIVTSDVGFGFDWRNSNNLRLGPFLRYTYSDSDLAGKREAVGLLLSAEKVASDGFTLKALGGFDYSTFEEGGDSAFNLTGTLEARGRYHENWAWEAELGVVTLPSVSSDGGFVTDYRASLDVTRSLPKGALSFGSEISYTRIEDFDSFGGDVDSSRALKLFGRYARPIFSDSAYLGAEMSYALGRGQSDWERLTFKVSVGTDF